MCVYRPCGEEARPVVQRNSAVVIITFSGVVYCFHIIDHEFMNELIYITNEYLVISVLSSCQINVTP